MSGAWTPLRIGAIDVGFPAVQAALSGYSDWPMRVIARRLGAPYTLCEVLLDRFVLDQKLNRANRRQLKVTDEEHPVGGQLMGAEPEQFAPAALKLVEAGFDVVDINFGCPVKKVLGRCRGGFLLSQPRTALEIVARVREILPPQIPVTVKMRRALDDTPQSRDNFNEIFTGAFELGVAAITVHGRTVVQRYVGPSNWDILADIKRQAGDRVVLGSGDLFSAKACIEMIARTGLNGVSIARGAIGNPWIFGQVRDAVAGKPIRWPSLFEQRDVLAEHFALSRETYGDQRSCALMRKFGIKYAQLHPHDTEVSRAFVAVKSPQEWHDVLTRWYGEDAPGRETQSHGDLVECAPCEAL
ncbi:MAG TPA: tRNA-dihydrouridine synthase [Planctomycetaceae bacterium]|nr:tRNA-dihydrouridine synthase [Planctomycetaceae bacterium]